MKDKRYGITFGIALVLVMLFTACSNIIDTSKDPAPAGNEYGRISVSFVGEAARTAFPKTIFDNYEYTFTKTGGDPTVKEPESDGFFTLEVGAYTVEVEAYIDAVAPANRAASGSASFTVYPSITADVLVGLSAVASSGTGFFDYTIIYPENASADITLVKWPGVNAPEGLDPDTTSETVDGETVNKTSETCELDAGLYLLTVRVTQDEKYAGTVKAVHIKPLLTTEYARVFEEGDLLAPPTADDFDISTSSLTQVYNNSPRSVIITPKTGKSDGMRIIYYVGTGDTTYTKSTTPPTNAGTYAVTFDVAATEGWNAATGLIAGTLTINKANGATVTLTATSITTDSITVNAAITPATGQSVEYAKDTSSTEPSSSSDWSTSTTTFTFTGLDAGTQYSIFARTVGTSNYETGVTEVLSVTTVQNVSLVLHYWVDDQHDSLVTAGDIVDGKVTIGANESVTITAQGAGSGYSNQKWYVNSMLDSVKNGSATYEFSGSTFGMGTYNVGLFVEKANKLYNTNITIVVTLPHTSPGTIYIAMHDKYGDGWDGGGALRINVNGVDIASNVRVSTGTANTYSFTTVTGDVVQVYWVAGSSQDENSFIIYHGGKPPDPAFDPGSWSGSNALIYRLYGEMASTADGELLGSFTVK
jgi:hypothetical protein